MDALDDPACCIYDRFWGEPLPYDHAYSPVRRSGVHTSGKEWICSDIPTVGSLHAQIPTVHTLSAQFLPVLSYTFSRLLVLGVQLSVRTPVPLELFENLPVPKALATLAIPTIVSQLITMIYNLSDTYFIGKTNNPYQIAAASLAYVLVFVMNALSNLFGVGGGSLISRLLGGQKTKEAKCVCAFSFYGAITISFLYSLGCYVFMDPLLRLLGASDSTIGFSTSYAFWVVVVGGIPSTLSMTMAQMLRSEGYARRASFGLGMGGI